MIGLCTYRCRLEIGKHAGVRNVTEPEPVAQEFQLWCCSPVLVFDANAEDPLSMAFSLRKHADDRVPLALDELEAMLSG